MGNGDRLTASAAATPDAVLPLSEALDAAVVRAFDDDDDVDAVSAADVGVECEPGAPPPIAAPGDVELPTLVDER